MNIENEISAAIAEFGDRAHERFLIAFKCEWLTPQDNKTLLIADNVKLKPPDELFSYGVEIYGLKNELLRWEYRHKLANSNDVWLQADSIEMNPHHSASRFYYFRRKTFKK